MSLSLADRFRAMTPAQQQAWLESLTDELIADIQARQAPWWLMGRPEQLAPPADKRWWAILAGRGWGKTKTGAEWAVDKARTHPGCRIGLVAVTYTDGRDVMVEGETGLLSCLHPSELRGGTVESAWNRSLGELYMANGSRFKLYSSERPRQLRGPQHHYVWGDEPSYWDDAHRGCARDSTFTNANFGMRLRPHPDWPDAKTFRPRGVLTMTPRPVELLKVPDDIARQRPWLAGLLQRRDVVVTRGKTSDNVHNLADDYRASVIDPLIGTTLGRQELDGELLEDVEGALWTQELINRARILVPPDLYDKTVIAFDPSGGGGVGHDEHGIVAAGSIGPRARADLYVIADYSLNGTPTFAARRVILAALEHDADAIVYEANQGLDWIPELILSTYNDMLDAGEVNAPLPTMHKVTAKKSKKLRAQPIVGLYEQTSAATGQPGRVHHIGTLGVLEGQQTQWVPDEGESPDRLDALVYALSWLWGEGPAVADVASVAARERRPGGRGRGSTRARMPETAGRRG